MSSPIFQFNTATKDHSQFIVTNFTGREAISELFEFKITVKVANALSVYFDDDDDSDGIVTIMEDSATFKMITDNYEKVFQGIVADYCSKNENSTEFEFYELTLVPHLFKETLTESSQGYSGPTNAPFTVVDIINSEIDQITQALAMPNYFRTDLLSTDYQGRPFTCQYKESNYNFMSRLMEKYGLYFYYNPTADQFEITDYMQHTSLTDLFPLLTLANNVDKPAGNSVWESIYSRNFNGQQKPSCVTISQFNPEQPSGPFTACYPEDQDYDNRYAVHLSENVVNDIEAQQFSKIRYEEMFSRSRSGTGMSGCCLITPGYELPNTNPSFVTEVNHVASGLDPALNTSGEVFYENTYTARRSARHFRPERKTPVPKVLGTETGIIYAEPNSAVSAEANRPELDDVGRYRVEFNFIQNSVRNRTTGALTDEQKSQVSHWLRKGEASAGTGSSMNIPLAANVEVTLSFISADPDLPYISSALSNARFPSHVTAENPNNGLIFTTGLLGLKALGGWHRSIHVDELDPSDPKFDLEPHTFTKMNNPGVNQVSVGADMTERDEYSGNYLIDRTYGDTYVFVDGNTYKWDNEKAYCFGNDYEEIHESEDDLATEVYDLTSKMQKVTLKGREGDDAGDYSAWVDGDHGLVEKSWGDKCEYHEGRAFCWSGGRGPGGSLETFNYGNGYTENLLESGEGTSADLAADKKIHDDYTQYKEIDATQSSIEKTYGATYGYQNGFSADIKVGDSHSKTYGNSWSNVTGNDRAVIEGDQYEDIHGNCESHHMGDWNKETFTGTKGEYALSATNSMTIGAANDMYLGAKNEMSLAVTSNIMIGASNDMALSAYMAIHVGACMELQSAAMLKLTVGVGIDLTSTLITDEAAHLGSSKLGTYLNGLSIFG